MTPEEIGSLLSESGYPGKLPKGSFWNQAATLMPPWAIPTQFSGNALGIGSGRLPLIIERLPPNINGFRLDHFSVSAGNGFGGTDMPGITILRNKNPYSKSLQNIVTAFGSLGFLFLFPCFAVYEAGDEFGLALEEKAVTNGILFSAYATGWIF